MAWYCSRPSPARGNLATPFGRRNPGVRLLVEFDGELEECWFRGPYGFREVVLTDAGATASRFCFDNNSREPTARDFDALILGTFGDVLESWRETIESSNDEPPRGLVKFFAERGTPLWEETDDE